MELTLAAQSLAALGHANRLEIFRILVQAGSAGMRIGDLQTALGRPASTVAFHLRALTSANLILQDREGREVYCRVNFLALDQVLQYVKQDCCKGVSLPVFVNAKAA